MFEKGFPQDKFITYSGMLWLLAAQIVVMLPLIFYLPIWLLPILIFSAGWRIRVLKGLNEQPGVIVKVIVGALGLAALAISGLKPVSLDMMASLLMLGFAYKALETIQRRDGMVVILTGYMLVGVLFLYSQSILTALYCVFSLAVLTGTQIAIQQPKSTAILPNLRLASLMLLLCLPLMILLFLFAPRFDPLWTVPFTSSHAKTGITDRMTPGDIAKLSQSDELAFSVKFLGERPRQNELYWRGLVLQHFDGNTWTQFSDDLDSEILKETLRTKKQSILNRLVQKGDQQKYEIIYEKSAQSWLFALSPVVNIEGDAFYGSDFRIMANRDVIEPMMLMLISYPEAIRELELSKTNRILALQLPKGENKKSRKLAQQLLASSNTKQEYIQKVLNRYREQDYYYTLRPPTLSHSNSIDAFLMESKKGFCAHYAGSFVFMMRAAGIPARVITGYQGGEWNENGNFLAIHQYDAHAWTEVWLEGQGWMRFDPTSMVAPERIEKNLETAIRNEGSFLEDNMLSLTKIKWLNSLRKRLDSTQYAWRRFVLGYDNDTQNEFLKRLFGEMTIQKTAIIVGSLFAGIILLWVIFLGLGRRRNNEAIEHQLYRRFCNFLEKKGVKREASQTPEYFSQLASAHLPSLSHEINAFTQTYSTLCYNPNAQNEQHKHIDKLKLLLKMLNKHK